MRIGINILYLIPRVVGGSETYARQLIKSILSQIGDDDELVLFCSRETSTTFKSDQKLLIVTLPIYSQNRVARLIAEQVSLPILCYKYGINLLLSLGYTQPCFLPCKSVVTVHDLNWYHHPEDFNLIPRLFLQLLVTMSAKRANAVIAISKSTKQSLVKVLSIDPKKIVVIYHGMTQPLIDGRAAKLVREKFSIPNKYLFTVLSHYAHKNLATIIQAFIAVQKNASDLHLVIAGTGTGDAKMSRTNYLKQLGNPHIHQLPFVTDQELAAVYHGSEIFVFPSAYEGFGLPVLEAMSHKVPVISSNAYALKEVVGSGGILVDPYNVEQYILSIKKLMKSNMLRQKYIKAGVEQVSNFTWDKCGSETLSLIRNLYATK